MSECRTLGCARPAIQRGGQLCNVCDARIRRRAERHAADVVRFSGVGVRGGTRHGTPKRYSLGCRCDPCTEANTRACVAYQQARRRHKPPSLVDPSTARALLRWLVERGWTHQAVARASGLSVPTLRNVERGRHRPRRATYDALRRLVDRDTAHHQGAA